MSLDIASLNNLKILYPAFLLLPLIYIFSSLRSKGRRAVSYGSVPALLAARSGLKVLVRGPVLFTLSFLTVLLFSFAASRPQIIDQVETPTESRNLMLTLDLSGSMGTVDFKTAYGYVNRLEAVKGVVSDFIRARSQDRIGLVVFGTNAFLQSPLTLDHSLLEEMMRRLQVGIAGEDTATGDGIAMGYARLPVLAIGWLFGPSWVALLEYVDDAATLLTALALAAGLAYLLVRVLRASATDGPDAE